jgi:competence protein ComEC
VETYGIGALQSILITHPDLDHYGGLDSLLARHEVKEGIWIHPVLLQSEKADKVLSMLERHQAPIHFLNSGENPYPGLECRLAPAQNSNEISPLCKYTIKGKAQILLTGDMDEKSEAYFLQEDKNFLQTDALKVAHHGSKTSSSQSFLDATRAIEAFISVGARNRYGHPTKATLSRLEKSHMQIHRTDLEGDVSWIQWEVLDMVLPGRSIAASTSPFTLLRSSAKAAAAPE